MVRAPAPPSRDRIAAAIDIGSYSVHLLVAGIGRRSLEVLHDESAFLGLGRRLEAGERLGAARATLRETIAGFVAQANALGAGTISVVGTDPLRRAVDRDYAIEEILAVTGVEVRVLSHEEEAMLALIGVQQGQPIKRELAMIDVGGGSTEVLVAGPDRDPVAVGLPLGAARLTSIHVTTDPPTPEQVGALRASVGAAFLAAPASNAKLLIAVGGTARSLLRVGPPRRDRELSATRVAWALELLSSAPAASIAERYNVRLSRALVLPAGAAILEGALARYRLPQLRVAAGGLREGLILAAHHAGPRWREELPALTRGWAHSGG